MKKAYIISAIKNEHLDMDYDAVLLPFEQSEMLGARIMSDLEFSLPERLYFLTSLAHVGSSDFIDNDADVPLMSSRLVDKIIQDSREPIRVIPVTLIDDGYLGQQFDESGNLRADVPINSNFAIIQPLKYGDYFDFENSIYDRSVNFPDEIDFIDELVLKQPIEDYPVVFRLKEELSSLFVNDSIKEFAEQNGFSGMDFEEV